MNMNVIDLTRIKLMSIGFQDAYTIGRETTILLKNAIPELTFKTLMSEDFMATLPSIIQELFENGTITKDTLLRMMAPIVKSVDPENDQMLGGIYMFAIADGMAELHPEDDVARTFIEELILEIEPQKDEYDIVSYRENYKNSLGV
jgi:hypothetical protein